jgi:molecular chaperone GrpE
MFGKMKQKEAEFDEPLEEGIPVFDKRRFNGEGERVADDPTPSENAKDAPVKSAQEAALETQLKAEIERREAAEAKLVGVQAKFDEVKTSLEKETAEMRERLKKTLEDKAKQAQFNFLTTLLPVLDNLNLAIAASETDPDIEHLRNGVVGTARSFEQALLSVGVEAVPAVGEKFDPELHEAVDMVEAEEDGLITKEYSRGYRFGDKLLRAARVQVGRA